MKSKMSKEERQLEREKIKAERGRYKEEMNVHLSVLALIIITLNLPRSCSLLTSFCL